MFTFSLNSYFYKVLACAFAMSTMHAGHFSNLKKYSVGNTHQHAFIKHAAALANKPNGGIKASVLPALNQARQGKIIVLCEAEEKNKYQYIDKTFFDACACWNNDTKMACKVEVPRFVGTADDLFILQNIFNGTADTRTIILDDLVQYLNYAQFLQNKKLANVLTVLFTSLVQDIAETHDVREVLPLLDFNAKITENYDFYSALHKKQGELLLDFNQNYYGTSDCHCTLSKILYRLQQKDKTLKNKLFHDAVLFNDKNELILPCAQRNPTNMLRKKSNNVDSEGLFSSLSTWWSGNSNNNNDMNENATNVCLCDEVWVNFYVPQSNPYTGFSFLNNTRSPVFLYKNSLCMAVKSDYPQYCDITQIPVPQEFEHVLHNCKGLRAYYFSKTPYPTTHSELATHNLSETPYAVVDTELDALNIILIGDKQNNVLVIAGKDIWYLEDTHNFFAGLSIEYVFQDKNRLKIGMLLSNHVVLIHDLENNTTYVMRPQNTVDTTKSLFLNETIIDDNGAITGAIIFVLYHGSHGKLSWREVPFQVLQKAQFFNVKRAKIESDIIKNIL